MGLEQSIIKLRSRIDYLSEEIEKIKIELHPYRMVKFKKLYPEAIPPQYQRIGDAGFDFYALINNELGFIDIFPQSQELIRTGISCSIPEGYEIQIRPRSGLALKNSITITNSPGTIDSGYCIPNEIKIILYNLSKNSSFRVKNGDRIAQGKLSFVYCANFEEVYDIPDEDKNRDRKGGFGSTGK